MRFALVMRTLVGLAVLVCVSNSAFGQAAIRGTVRDPSGSALAAVSVEASSAVLIEKTRTAITDRAGRYRIEDLRPGRYQVRFTRQGWKTYQHEGVELTGSFTTTVDVELDFKLQ